MISRLDRYLARTIIGSTAMVLLVLLGVQSFIQLAAQLQDVGKGDFTFAQAFLFVPMMLPSDLYQLFPMAALIGCLLGLGRLSSQFELVVMRTSGYSIHSVARAVVMSALLMLVVVTLIGEGVAPMAREAALTMKHRALSEGQMLQTSRGIWLRDHNRFIHIGHIVSKTELQQITMNAFNEQHTLALSKSAERAVWDAQTHQWRFFDVRESHFAPGKITSRYLDQDVWPVNIDTRLVTLSKVDPNQQNLLALHRYMHFRQSSGLGQGLYAFVFWKRLLQPFASVVMILLAIPFIFGPLQRTSNGLRVVIGILVGFGFFIMNQFFGPLSQVYQLPPLLAAMLPSVMFAFLGVYLLRRFA